MPSWRRLPRGEGPTGAAGGQSTLQTTLLQHFASKLIKDPSTCEVSLDVPVIPADGIEGGAEKRFLHRPQRLAHVVGKVGTGSRIATVEPIGEQIVFSDHIVGDTKRMQDQCAGKTGAVLAGRTVDDERRAIPKKVGEQRAEARRIVTNIVSVGISHPFQ